MNIKQEGQYWIVYVSGKPLLMFSTYERALRFVSMGEA